MKYNLEQLKELIEILEESNLAELEIKVGDTRVRLRKDMPQQAVSIGHQAASAPTTTAGGPATATNGGEPAGDDGAYVTSPFVGTFYRRPSPEAEPFVQLGEEIAPGQVLCIVEAMKLMNEIEAEVAGKIAEILVEEGKPVEFGDRLFRIEPS